MMSWKRFMRKLSYSFIMLSKHSYQEAAMISFIPGTYKREWKDSECENVEILNIYLYNEIAEVYVISIVKSRLVIHNEQMVYTKQPDEWFAVYDSGTKQLVEIGGSRAFTFFPDENHLLLNMHQFIKVKSEEPK